MSTITFLDGIYVNVKREGRVEKTTVYVVLAVDLDGRKDVLRHGVGDGAEGAKFWTTAQCDSCHIPNLTTGIHPTIPQLSNQNIRPFTDLLLHDMGDGLADNQTDYQATGTEWRTPPLWGIGLFETVNRHTYYLHDGRARNLTEAILWHGGEAQASRDYFLNLSAADREALLTFLRSL